MNKLFFLLGLLLFIGLSACNKCYDCGSYSLEFCEDDYSGNQLDDLETVCENNGGNWHLSVD